MFDASLAYHRTLWKATYFYFSHIRKRYPDFVDRKKAIFIHIPETAGLSMAYALYGREAGHHTLADYQQADERKFRTYFKFSFVRNPWDRLVSAYFYLAEGGMPTYKFDRLFSEKVVRRYDTFERFVMEWLDEKNMYKHVHFIPQAHFITDRHGRVGLDFLGRYENISEDFQEVCKRLNLSVNLEKNNPSKHTHYSSYYTNKELIRKVASLYEMDLSLLGYTF